MPNEMTAAEATEIIERGDCGKCRYDAEDTAVRILRAIAAGEYKRVVHAHIVGRGWDLHCSNCGASADIGNDYCPDCGARMDKEAISDDA